MFVIRLGCWFAEFELMLGCRSCLALIRLSWVLGMVVISFEFVGVWINAGFWRSCWDLAVLVWFQFSLGLLVFAEFSIVAGSCCWIRALRCLGMVVICFEVVCVCGDSDCSVVELDGLG